MRIVSLSISALILALTMSGCNTENKEEAILQYSDHILERLSAEYDSVVKHKDDIKAAVAKFVAQADKSDLAVVEEIAEFISILTSEAIAVAKEGKESLKTLGARHLDRFKRLQTKAKSLRIGTKAAAKELKHECARFGLWAFFSTNYSELGFDKKGHNHHGHGHHHGHSHGHSHGHHHHEEAHVHDEHCGHDHHDHGHDHDHDHEHDHSH